MDNSERAGNHSAEEIEELVRQVEALPDANARAIAIKLVRAVMEFHASAVARMLEIVSQSAHGEAAVQSMVQNETVASLLALHGLHPDDVETRVRRAVDSLERFFETWGARISLAGFHDGTVTLRFESRGGSSAAATRIIEDAVYQAAPEITALTITGLHELPEAGFVPLSALMGAAARRPPHRRIASGGWLRYGASRKPPGPPRLQPSDASCAAFTWVIYISTYLSRGADVYYAPATPALFCSPIQAVRNTPEFREISMRSTTFK